MQLSNIFEKISTFDTSQNSKGDRSEILSHSLKKLKNIRALEKFQFFKGSKFSNEPHLKNIV